MHNQIVTISLFVSDPILSLITSGSQSKHRDVLEHDSIRSGDGSEWYYFDKVHDVASRRELSRLDRRCNRSRNFRARASPSRDNSWLG